MLQILQQNYIRKLRQCYTVTQLNHANGIKKRSSYLRKLRENYDTKITLELRQEVTLDLG